jgi:hypothetical protein
MRVVRLLCLVASIPLWLASAAQCQLPTITSINVDTGCIYIVGVSKTPCEIGPGMVVTVNGNSFGEIGGGIDLCDCPFLTTITWAPTKITGLVGQIAPDSTIYVETAGGSYSNSLPYAALGPVIESIESGKCTYLPNKSVKQCVIAPGTQITIKGRNFGGGPGEVGTCDCESAVIDSWDPDWAINPSPTHDTIVATAVDTEPGSTISVFINGILSNAIPYTTCGQ